uniref:PyrF2 n=1 Tax=Streptomyces rugosporus TaxID=295838 RepID=K7QSJ2_STRRG|nr:PyrF2 [Streptomyces rugosporus]
MRYDILGPLRVVDEGNQYFISARKIEIVLAGLLIRSDQIVTSDQLMEEVWGLNPPRRATAGLHVYISQVRKFLLRPGHGDRPIMTRPPGYLLRKGEDEIDFHVFLRLINQGRDEMRRGRFEEASELLEKAMGLWRGTVLGEACGGPIIEGFTARMVESRLECLQMLMDAQLELGRHRELVGRLYALIAEYPLCEAFYRQLMLALYRSERQADALEVYQTARRILNGELGLEPCQALRDLQAAILSADQQLHVFAAAS